MCIPIGALFVAAVVFIWWHRRRKRAGTDPARESSSQNHGSGSHGDPFTGKPELGGSAVGNPFEKRELDAGNEIGPGVPGAPAELPVRMPPAELSAVTGEETAVAELPGDIGGVGLMMKSEVQDISDADGNERRSNPPAGMANDQRTGSGKDGRENRGIEATNYGKHDNSRQVPTD